MILLGMKNAWLGWRQFAPHRVAHSGVILLRTGKLSRARLTSLVADWPDTIRYPSHDEALTLPVEAQAAPIEPQEFVNGPPFQILLSALNRRYGAQKVPTLGKLHGIYSV